jgi:outer membrane protein insertion porin family
MKFSLLILALIVSSGIKAADVVDVKFRALDGFGGDVSSAQSRCQTRAGNEYDKAVLSHDVSLLRDSGMFEQVSADVTEVASGVEVVFYVKRKMRFKAPIQLKGVEEFSESKISSIVDLKEGFLYGESDFALAAERVRKEYQKKHFPDAKVSPIVKHEGNGVCTLTVLVDEGQRQKLRDFKFIGAESPEISQRDLHNAIGDFPWWNVKGWFQDRPVTHEEQLACIDKIVKFYKDKGYLDVQVDGPEKLVSDDGRLDIRFKILEGPVYKVGKVSVEGLTCYPEAAIRGKSDLPPAGSVAGEAAIQEASRRVEIAVGSGDLGLADSHVDVKYIPQQSDPTVVDLVFTVKEGVPVVINEVKIRGNDYTKDKVIRREIALAPGDRMLADRAESSRRRLENLGYFNRVSFKLEPTMLGADKNGNSYRDLVYEVDEKNTGSFMVGIGASSVDSVFVSAELSQSNFDLFAPGKFFRGAGQKGRIYAQAGPRIQSYEASITEPHLFGRFLEFSVEGYRRNRWYDEYDIIRSGVGASLSYPVKFLPNAEPFGRLGFKLSGELIEFDEIENGEYVFEGNTVSIKKEDSLYGDAFEPVLRIFWANDSRDNFRTPTKGHRTQIFADIAPAGDNEYWRAGFTHRSYFNVVKSMDHVLMAGVRVETIDGISDEVPIYNRMFLGGPKSIRGIEYRNVAPFAKGDNESMPWGGQTLFCANFEYTIPVFKMLRIAAFTDIGSVGVDDFDFDFSDNFAWTAGIGFRLDIPMFPIRLDFAAPIEKPDEAEKEVFSFTVGYDF